jgi:hypothetical protein
MPNDRRVVAVVKFETVVDTCQFLCVRRDVGFDVVKEFDFAVWPLPNYGVDEI